MKNKQHCLWAIGTLIVPLVMLVVLPMCDDGKATGSIDEDFPGGGTVGDATGSITVNSIVPCEFISALVGTSCGTDAATWPEITVELHPESAITTMSAQMKGTEVRACAGVSSCKGDGLVSYSIAGYTHTFTDLDLMAYVVKLKLKDETGSTLLSREALVTLKSETANVVLCMGLFNGEVDDSGAPKDHYGDVCPCCRKTTVDCKGCNDGFY